MDNKMVNMAKEIIDIYSNKMKQDIERQAEVTAAFMRFKVWLAERELPENIINKNMYMGISKCGVYYCFKNSNTRNYTYVNIEPTDFNR